MKEYIQDYFELTDEEKFARVKHICLQLYNLYIDTSSEHAFHASLTHLLKRLEEDIIIAEQLEDYEVCEVGKRIINIFNQLDY